MTDIETNRHNDGGGVVAPTTVVAVLPADITSALADAVRAAPFVLVQARTVDEAAAAIDGCACAILVTTYPLPHDLGEWLRSTVASRLGPRPPILLLSDPTQLAEAIATGIADLVLEAGVSAAQLLQALQLLARLTQAEQLTTAPLLQASSPGKFDAENALQRLPIALICSDDSGRIHFWNQAALELFGKSACELGEATIGELLADTGIEAALRVSSGSTPWVAGDFVRVSDARVTEIEYLVSRTAEPGKLLVILQDATQRNRKLARQHRADKLRSLGRLVGGMAHEFNNLLTVILGYSDLSAKLAAGDSRFSDALMQIKNSAERGANLTQLLLAFGRKQVMAPTWIDLNQLLGGLEGQIRIQLGDQVRVVLQTELGLPRVFIDPMLVQRALMQVVANARDAITGPSTLSLSTSLFEATEEFALTKPELRPGRYVCLAVHDDGAGIPSDVLPYIFEPFFTTKTVGRGTGMGLAFVDGVMHQSGGSVDVGSEPGAGTTVRLFFSTVGMVPAGFSSSTPVSPAPASTATVLLVDDDEGVRKFGSLVLRSQNYNVIEARDRAEALRIVEQDSQRIDLVITDVIMPMMSGIELGTRLAALRPTLPVLYQSGRVEDIHVGSEGAERNRHFLSKPFTREALLAKCSQLLLARKG